MFRLALAAELTHCNIDFLYNKSKYTPSEHISSEHCRPNMPHPSRPYFRQAFPVLARTAQFMVKLRMDLRGKYSTTFFQVCFSVSLSVLVVQSIISHSIRLTASFGHSSITVDRFASRGVVE